MEIWKHQQKEKHLAHNLQAFKIIIVFTVKKKMYSIDDVKGTVEKVWVFFLFLVVQKLREADFLIFFLFFYVFFLKVLWLLQGMNKEFPFPLYA